MDISGGLSGGFPGVVHIVGALVFLELRVGSDSDASWVLDLDSPLPGVLGNASRCSDPVSESGEPHLTLPDSIQANHHLPTRAITAASNRSGVEPPGPTHPERRAVSHLPTLAAGAAGWQTTQPRRSAARDWPGPA